MKTTAVKNNATPTGVKYYEKFSTFVEYSYKGHKYEVEYPNSIDYCITAPSIQHKLAQENIDDKINHKSNEESSQIGLDMFFEITK